MTRLRRRMWSDADLCRRNGWGPGTRLIGDEGYGPTVIEITAIGEQRILAVEVSHDGGATRPRYERSWVLFCREWRAVDETGDGK